MQHSRKRHGADFKATVSLEAIKGIRTINELASEYELHPTQITRWKNQMIQDAASVFSGKHRKTDSKDEALRDRLYQQIGQLQVELDWLKKKTRSVK